MTDKNFLSFDNYVDRDFENEDWITVARSEDVDSNKEIKLLIILFYEEYFLLFNDSSKFIFYYISQMETKIKL